MLLNSNNYGWRRVQYNIQAYGSFFFRIEKNLGTECLPVFVLTFCLSKTPLHSHYDCVNSKSIDLFIGSQFLNYSQTLTTFINEMNGLAERMPHFHVTRHHKHHHHYHRHHHHHPHHKRTRLPPATISSTMNSGKVNFLFAFCTSTESY